MTRDRKIIHAKAGPLELAGQIGNAGKTGRAMLLAAAALALPASPAWGGEAALLAERILAAECNECLVFDTASRQALAAELESVLARIRERRPDVADIRARVAFRPRTLLIEAEPALLAALAQAPEGKTGDSAVDALNEALDLGRVQVFFGDTALLSFAGQVNVAAAARAYREAEGVERANPDGALGDGSDIAAARLGAVWHVIIDRAWGDCPAGCIHRETAYFTVSGVEVTEVEPTRGRRMSGFMKALSYAGSGRFAGGAIVE